MCGWKDRLGANEHLSMNLRRVRVRCRCHLAIFDNRNRVRPHSANPLFFVNIRGMVSSGGNRSDESDEEPRPGKRTLTPLSRSGLNRQNTCDRGQGRFWRNEERA